jgi:hypothetical protein
MIKALFLSVSIAIMFVGYAYAEDAKPEVKKVCIDQKDAKTGKTKQVCKDVKQHKKLEGTDVPVKK